MSRYSFMGLVSVVSLTVASCGGQKNNDGSAGDNNKTGEGSNPTPSETNKSGDSGGNVTFSGQLAISTGLVDQTANRVLPIPMNNRGEPSVTALSSVDIGVNGKFDMSINTGPDRQDWIFLLIDDKSAKKMDQIRGFIGLSAAGDDLIKMPLADAKKDGVIDLGMIAAAYQDVAKASATIDQKSTELNIKTNYLREMASVDGVLRGIKNDWANFNEKTGVFYSTSPFFNWYLNLSGSPGAATDPSSFIHTGFGIYFSTNDPSMTLEALCSPSSNSKHKSLEVIPPVDVVDSSNVAFNSSNPMSNSGVTGIQPSGSGYDCGAGTFYANGSSATGGAGFNVGGGGFPQAMPNGSWKLKFAGEEVAVFDMESARPVDANGLPFVYVPSIKINADVQSYVDSIEVDFYTYDRTTKSYKKVEDITVISKTIIPNITFADYSGTVASSGARIESGADLKVPSSGSVYRVSMQDFTLRNGAPSPKFKLPGDSSVTEPVASSITVAYKIGKSNFRFDVRGGN